MGAIAPQESDQHARAEEKRRMESRERFLAALNGEKPDRTPVAHVAALTTVQLQQSTGCRV